MLSELLWGAEGGESLILLAFDTNVFDVLNISDKKLPWPLGQGMKKEYQTLLSADQAAIKKPRSRTSWSKRKEKYNGDRLGYSIYVF